MAQVGAHRGKPNLSLWAVPFSVFGSDLPPNITLAAKLIVLAFMLQRTWPLSDHFLPFFSALDKAGSPSTFRGILTSLVVLGAVVLFLTRHARAASLVVGASILLSLAASRTLYSNNLAYTGCVLFLIGLQSRTGNHRLLQLQVVLLYLGAGLNKLLDEDWRSGQFFEYWYGVVYQQEWYLRVVRKLPSLLLSKVMSWVSFTTELALAVGFSIKRLFPYAVFVGLTFHTTMLLMTGLTFRMFYFAVSASYLAFVTWPDRKMDVLYDTESRLCCAARSLFERVDLESRFEWRPLPSASGGVQSSTIVTDKERRIHLFIGDNHYNGWNAVRLMLLYNPLTYFFLTVLLRMPDSASARPWIALSALLVLSPVSVVFGLIISTVARRRAQARCVKVQDRAAA